MANRPPQFPISSYDQHLERTKTLPIPEAEKSGFLSGNFCLPNQDGGEYRRYSATSDNEGFTHGHFGGTDTFTLGAVACPRVLKCSDCPIESSK